MKGYGATDSRGNYTYIVQQNGSIEIDCVLYHMYVLYAYHMCAATVMAPLDFNEFVASLHFNFKSDRTTTSPSTFARLKERLYSITQEILDCLANHWRHYPELPFNLAPVYRL